MKDEKAVFVVKSEAHAGYWLQVAQDTLPPTHVVRPIAEHTQLLAEMADLQARLLAAEQARDAAFAEISETSKLVTYWKIECYRVTGKLADLQKADRGGEVPHVEVFRICEHCNQEYLVPLVMHRDAGYLGRNFCNCPYCEKRDDPWIRLVVHATAESEGNDEH